MVDVAGHNNVTHTPSMLHTYMPSPAPPLLNVEGGLAGPSRTAAHPPPLVRVIVTVFAAMFIRITGRPVASATFSAW